MALKPTMARNPALKPILAGMFAKPDNVFFAAIPQIGNGAYAVSQLKHLALEP